MSACACPHCGKPFPAAEPAAGLTKRQAELLDFIRARRVCPSVREMAAHLGLASVSGVVRLLNSLEERGYIRRLPGQARSIAVVRRAA